jgi:DnaJ-domain-containing protein 1
MTRLSDGKFGPTGKKLADLTDRELRDERARRRGKQLPDEARPTLRRVRQYLANLELSPGATWPEVERAYKRLRERYSPDKHEGHPERHETALELNESLSKAYEALRTYFGAK